MTGDRQLLGRGETDLKDCWTTSMMWREKYEFSFCKSLETLVSTLGQCQLLFFSFHGHRLRVVSSLLYRTRRPGDSLVLWSRLVSSSEKARGISLMAVFYLFHSYVAIEIDELVSTHVFNFHSEIELHKNLECAVADACSSLSIKFASSWEAIRNACTANNSTHSI